MSLEITEISFENSFSSESENEASPEKCETSILISDLKNHFKTSRNQHLHNKQPDVQD